MGDKIVFLGTAGDSIVTGKQYRASGGIIIQAERLQFHIDPGPGSLVMAKYYQINLRENTALFVSHNHLNHAGDINAVISAMTHDGLDKKGVLVASSSVVSGAETFITNFYRGCTEKIITAEAGTKIGINNVDINFTKTIHGDEKGVGFKFFFPEYSVGYVSDTEYFPELAEDFFNTDIMILNVTYPKGMKAKNNMNVDDAALLLQKSKPRLAIITHFGIKMLESDPIYETREIQKLSPCQVIAAKDGLVINPDSFAQIFQHKNLK